MELKDFMDVSKLQKIQDDFSNATGLAAITVGINGEYLTKGSNFTDFCMKYPVRHSNFIEISAMQLTC